ncbi:MAG: PIN domain-containing protein [Cyclobacteriaceae bacterium]
MKVVVDTNILFSALINPTGKIANIILNNHSIFDFYAPSTALEELTNHRFKLSKASKLTYHEIDRLTEILMRHISVIDFKSISKSSRVTAVEMLMDIDKFDIPFLALSIDINAKIWTGDKKLTNGLLSKGYKDVMDTAALGILAK